MKTRSIKVLAAFVSMAFGVAALGQSAPEVFPKAKINLQVGEKKAEIESLIRLDQSTLAIQDRKSGVAIKTIPFNSIKTIEYSYAKSPRWKTAILVSPLFLFTSGKKHWLMVQGDGDYALVQMDKSNYKLILAAIEAKSGKKIETVEDSK